MSEPAKWEVVASQGGDQIVSLIVQARDATSAMCAAAMALENIAGALSGEKKTPIRFPISKIVIKTVAGSEITGSVIRRATTIPILKNGPDPKN
jgi:hypothetical protein